jgi:hypothetical protein
LITLIPKDVEQIGSGISKQIFLNEHFTTEQDYVYSYEGTILFWKTFIIVSLLGKIE